MLNIHEDTEEHLLQVMREVNAARTPDGTYKPTPADYDPQDRETWGLVEALRKMPPFHGPAPKRPEVKVPPVTHPRSTTK